MANNEQENVPNNAEEGETAAAPPEAGGETSQNSLISARKEYIANLKQWIDQARMWQALSAGFPQYYQSQVQENPQNIPLPNNLENNAFPPMNQNFPGNFPFAEPAQQLNPTQFATAFPRTTYEFTIPPLWKRFVAEFLDFIILFIIKLLLTFCVLESFNLMNFEHYGLELLHKNFQASKMTMQMSVEILVLEIVHRFVVCFYEAYWLKGGQCATPGKWYMGLMVIRADSVVAVAGRPEGTVRVLPCTPLGIQKAFIRAFIKNLFIGLMLPICFALYVFRFNRTGYDIIASSLVVEWNHNLPFRPVD